jgi:Methionyl-tRNA formyltransferase
MRAAAKSSLYRNEVTDAAVAATRLALRRIAAGERPVAPTADASAPRGRARPAMPQTERAIDWARDDSATVLRKVRASDGAPGVRDEVLGVAVFLHGVHPEGVLPAKGAPGAVVAQRDGAILRATRDGAVWITHLRRADGAEPAVKLPAAMVLGDRLDGVAEAPLAADCRGDGADLARDPVRGARPGRLAALRIPQRCDEHRAMRSVGRCAPRCEVEGPRA